MNAKDVKTEFGLIVLASYSPKTIVIYGLWADSLASLIDVEKRLGS